MAASPALWRRRSRSTAASSLWLLTCAALLRALCPVMPGWGAAWAEPPPMMRQSEELELPASRRSLMLLSASAAGSTVGGENARAQLWGEDMTNKVQEFTTKGGSKTGIRPYKFIKLPGFKRYSNVIDPGGYLFRYVNDTYLTFITRAEVKPNASTDFNPEDVIAEYRLKYSNETGSSYTLIRGGPTPDRVDEKLGIKYYEVEYVVRTQLGFTYDTLRSLHFLTVFAAAPESLYILNMQAQDEKWDKDGAKLREIASSFAVIG